MRTKLGSWSERLVEAMWLGIVVILPVAFSFYAHRSFSVIKVTLFRSMAVAMATGVVIGLLETRHQRPGPTDGGAPMLRRVWDWARQPLILPAIAVAVVQLLSTALSVLPRLSIAGLYRRVQGTYTTLCYLVLFFALHHLLRRRGQIHRLLTAIVVTSLPVALYAMAQRFRVDPIRWDYLVHWRSISTIGNPIFLGAYLTMVIPLTVRGLIRAVRSFAEQRGSRVGASLAAGLHLALLVLQGAAVLFSGSRGPVIGLFGGLLFFLLLAAVRRGSRVMLLVTVVAGLLLAGFLIIANVPGPVRSLLVGLPTVERLTQIVYSDTVRQRILIWQGAAQMVMTGGWRALLGHGPETMYYAFQPYIVPELVHSTGSTLAHDRAHNAAWDALVTQGFLGLGVYLCLFGSLFYRGLQSLGCVKGPRDRLWFLILSGLGVSIGAVMPRALSGTWTFLGLGVSAGLLAAQLLYLFRLLLIRRTWEARLEGGDLLLIAILSALVVHFVEIQVGVPVTVTRVNFWVFAAVIAVASSSRLEGAEAFASRQDAPQVALKRQSGGRAASKRARKARRGRLGTPTSTLGLLLRSPLASYGLILGLLLLALGTSFVSHTFRIETHLPLLVLLTIVWLGGTGFFFLDVLDWSAFSPREFGWARSLAFFASLSLLPLLVGVPLHTIGFPPSEQRAAIVTIDRLLLGATLAALAFTLLPRKGPGQWLPSRRKAWLYLAPVLVAVALNVRTNLNLARANLWFQASLPLSKAEEWNAAIASLRRARSLAPGQPRFSLFLGRAYTKRASADPERRDRWLREAEEELQKAVELNPLDPELYAHLGQVYFHQAEAAGGSRKRLDVLVTSLDHFNAAVELSPVVQAGLLRIHRQVVHEALAHTYDDLGNLEEAVAHAEAAREVAPEDQIYRLDSLVDELRSQ